MTSRKRRTPVHTLPALPAPVPSAIPEAILPENQYKSFLHQSTRFPNFWNPGICCWQTIVRGIPIEMMTHRDPNGILRAIFSFFPYDFPPREDAGNFLVFVDPAWQRQGIASELFEIADQKFSIDLTNQRYTPSCRAFAVSMAERRGYIGKRRFAVDMAGKAELTS